MALLIASFGALNSALAAAQRVVLGRRIAAARIREHPIFILGHWRSGTTLLHNLLALDPRHTYPDTYACFAPNHFLLTRRIFPPLLAPLLPARRPTDNMPFGWRYPQEDEFALCNMGLPSPYLAIAFPNQPPAYPEYLSLENLSSGDKERWQQALRWFLQCVTLECDRRIVLKSPPHTARIRTLLEMFPRARFLHIVRDPFTVFASTVNLWQRLFRDQGLESPRFDGLDEFVLATFERMYHAFERDRALLAPDQFCEVRYEDLVASPEAELRRLYDTLGLGGFDGVLPHIRSYFAAHSNHVTGSYRLSPEQRALVSRRWSGYLRRYGYRDLDSRCGPALDFRTNHVV